MASFTFDLPDELAEQFRQAAVRNGGGAALLRRLIQHAVTANQARPQTHHEGNFHFNVRISEADREELRLAAAPWGMTPNAWAAALIRSRMRRLPSFGRGGEASLIAIQTELRRIGVSIHQSAKAVALSTADQAELVAEMLAWRDEVRGQLTGLRATLAGNLRYWEGEP